MEGGKFKTAAPLFERVDSMCKLRELCVNILENPHNLEAVDDLKQALVQASPSAVRVIESISLAVFYPILKNISANKNSYNNSHKLIIIQTLQALFGKIEMQSLAVFFNFYGFLVSEIYNVTSHSVADISEEHKLAIIQCTCSLFKSISACVVVELYVKENAVKFSQMLFVLMDVCKNEPYKKLRMSSITCLMSMARVLDDADFNDPVLTNQVADIFIFFLPGIASQLKSVALSDEKVGSRIPALALKAWGRIVAILMRDYGPPDHSEAPIVPIDKTRWKNQEEMNQYINKSQRSAQWYQKTDVKLRPFLVEFMKLTHHSHPHVRQELLNACSVLIDNCMTNMPHSMTCIVEIVVTLSQDDDNSIATASTSLLESLSGKFGEAPFKHLLDNLEAAFYDAIKSLPRKFNGIDENEQMAALNLITGYLHLFNCTNLVRLFHSCVHLNELMLTLVHISQLDTSGVSILETYTTEEIDTKDFRTNWTNFRYFKSAKVAQKIETVCRLCAEFGAVTIASDYLLDLLLQDREHTKEVIFLLNGLLTGIDPNCDNDNTATHIISTYIDSNLWYKPLTVEPDSCGYQPTLGEVQSNIIQVCLLIEGIGKLALTLGTKFDCYLLKTLYLILERAGSSHPLVKNSGLFALFNISKACRYADVMDLISNNDDYIAFFVGRKLKRNDQSVGVLNVLSVVMKYSSIEVLDSTADIIQKLLIQCEEPKQSNLNACLQVFRMFVHSMTKWLNLDPHRPEPFKTKKQKQEEFEHYQVSGVDAANPDFSDQIMGKTAEEMYDEDLQKNEQELEDEQAPSVDTYKKIEPPRHIKLVSSVLSKSLHFMPSRDKQRKLLVLEILICGLAILKQWDDELLPLVHQSWSPLVDRFKETDPLVINYSFKLLSELALLSKDFIRSRTAKDVLPQICTLIEQMSKESYLKDKGAAYRYTQAYKLQVVILEGLAAILINLDVLDRDLERGMDSVLPYLSDKQPLPLQNLALDFLKTLHRYDPDPVTKKLSSWLQQGKNKDKEYVRNLNDLDACFKSDCLNTGASQFR